MPRTLALLLLSLTACQFNQPDTPLELRERLQQMSAAGIVTVAHRGASGSHPENTLPAFSAALDAGAEMVELDFYQSADGVLVCFHDKSLERTTNASGPQRKSRVGDHDFASLQVLDAGAWKGQEFRDTRIPSLEAALRCIQAGAITMVEHKAGDPARLVALLRRMDLVEQVLVQSFDWDWLRAVHQLEPRLCLAALGGTKSRPDLDPETMRALRETGACMVHWSLRRLDAKDAAAARRAGLMLCVYTVNEPADYRRAIGLGARFITTDHPARLRRLLTAEPHLNQAANQ